MGKIKNGIYWLNEIVKYLGIKIRIRPYYKYLLDFESKRIMKIRERNIIRQYNIESFIKDLVASGKTFKVKELAEYVGKNIVLYQLNQDQLATIRMNYTKILLDNSEWEGNYRVLTISDSICLNENEFIVPIYSKTLDSISLTKRFGDRVYIPKYAEVLIGEMGNQYFDVFQADVDEIICDCGAYDGTTEKQISEWTNCSYAKIYAFEPNQINCRLCEKFYCDNNLENIILVKKGTWSEDTTLFFSVDEESAGGRLLEEGTSSVPVVAIDNIVSRDERVTYIKMDVEGAELESLKGAKKTIQRNAPRLAICIYHKKEDLWTIPEYILSLNSDYRFYIRHYCSYLYETVLYAIAK